MIDHVLLGQLTRQLIQDLDCRIALNKGFVLTLNYEIRLLKLNSSEHIKVQFLFEIKNLLHQFTSMEFTEVRLEIHSLTCKDKNGSEKQQLCFYSHYILSMLFISRKGSIRCLLITRSSWIALLGARKS